MRFSFRPLPGVAADVARPIVDVTVRGIEETGFACLLDTGSLHNRFANWIAREAGLDIESVEPQSLGVGGRPVIARTIPVALRIGTHEWDAPVSFCDPWPWDFQLLGQEGFFRYFRVALEAAAGRFDLTPSR